MVCLRPGLSCGVGQPNRMRQSNSTGRRIGTFINHGHGIRGKISLSRVMNYLVLGLECVGQEQT